MRNILVAGVGNALKADDAFGVNAAAALKADPRCPRNVTVLETGIGGIHLVQELMRGYDVLILFDAFDRKGEPGQVYLLEPDVPDSAELSESERRDFFADVHYATPIRALTLAKAIGHLPDMVRIIGCQPADIDALHIGMDERVKRAIPEALDRALEVIADQATPDGN